METTLLFLAACLMFSGVHSESQSMSCSTVNGKTICNKQTSDGNSAMASSQARFGGGSSSQRTYAGAGSSDNWDSSSQTLNGGYPDGFYNPPPSYDYYGNQESPGSFGGDSAAVYSTDYPDTGVATGIFGGPFTGVSSFVSSGSPNFFTGSQAGGGAFAGGGPFTGASSFVSSGSPNLFTGSQAGGGAFAGGGPFTGASSFVSSGSPNFFTGSQAGGGAFAGGRRYVARHYVFPSAGFPNVFSGSRAGTRAVAGGPYVAPHYAFPFVGFPNAFSNSQAGARAVPRDVLSDSQAGASTVGDGFAAAGNVPFFSSGVNYPAQDSSSSSGGAPAQGSGYAGSVPVPSNPFDFVRGFMGGGGPAAGAFAGAGFFPLGRR